MQDAGCGASELRIHHSAFIILHSSQWPVVQQQQHKRQRHQRRFAHQPQGEEKEREQVKAGSWMSKVGCWMLDVGCWMFSAGLPHSAFRIPHIRPHGQQPEKRAQHILPLRDPRDRVHLQRMQRKQPRHHRAPPKGPRHPAQHQEQQQRIGDMKGDIDQVMRTGVQPE